MAAPSCRPVFPLCLLALPVIPVTGRCSSLSLVYCLLFLSFESLANSKT
uniref:Uncharacterized protein n=1 Tax=Phakopsora pachyrhizi TaxID=170000 RepID=A0A0S1MJL1_PHAPC